MKALYRIIAIACLSIAGSAGCAENAPVEPVDVEGPSETTVIRYDAEDIAALPLGEFVQFDLDVPNTVYALTYSNPADLDHVLVIRGEEKYVLGDQAPGADKNQTDAPKQLVVSDADLNLVPAVCNCPCCQLVDGRRVCC